MIITTIDTLKDAIDNMKASNNKAIIIRDVRLGDVFILITEEQCSKLNELKGECLFRELRKIKKENNI